MQSNLLVQNDPMLVALLAVGPWTILLVSILVRVAVPGMFAYFGHVYQVSSQIDAGPMSIFGQVRSVIGEPGVLDVAVLAKSKGRR